MRGKPIQPHKNRKYGMGELETRDHKVKYGAEKKVTEKCLKLTNQGIEI